MGDRDKIGPKWKGRREFETKNGNVASVSGDNKLVVQNANNDQDIYPAGALINDNTTNTQFLQRAGFRGGRIHIEGDNVRDNDFVQWHGGHNTVFMKDGENITGNRFDAGFEEGLKYAIGKTIDFFEQPIKKMQGKTSPRRLEDDTIVLPGRREDYQFEFNNDVSKIHGIYTGTVDITHLATGATNNFANYEYVVFGNGRNLTWMDLKDPSVYVELSQIKAEQEATAAVGKTGEQITPVSKTAPPQLPPVRGDDLHPGGSHDRSR